MYALTLMAVVVHLGTLVTTLGIAAIPWQAHSQTLNAQGFRILVAGEVVPKPQSQEEQESTEPEDKSVKSDILTLKLAFKAHPLLFPYDIEVENHDNAIELSGKVSTEIEKEVAHRVATIMTDGHAVTSAIEVDKELVHILEEKHDKTITRTLQERFSQSKTLSEAKFDIKTEKGIVSLSGSTRFQVILLEATQAAKEVPGVRAVLTDRVQIESSDK